MTPTKREVLEAIGIYESVYLAPVTQELNHADIEKYATFYPSIIPDALQELSSFRRSELPSRLAERKKQCRAFTEKAELEKLVEWKLYTSTLIQSKTKQDTTKQDKTRYPLPTPIHSLYSVPQSSLFLIRYPASPIGPSI